MIDLSWEEPFVAGALLWRQRSGEPFCTIVAKATFRLRPTECEPAPVDDPLTEMDLAPFKPSSDITLAGPLFLPAGRTAARLVVGSVDKSFDGSTPLGPLARNAPTRTRLLRNQDHVWVDQPMSAPVPQGFDARFYQAAPEDQRLGWPIQANERILLEALHREHERLVTSLPGLEPRAVVLLPREEVLRFVGDALHVDTERATVTVTWRVQTRAPDDPSSMRVSIAKARMGQDLSFADLKRIREEARVRRAAGPRVVSTLDHTAAEPSDPPGQALPFPASTAPPREVKPVKQREGVLPFERGSSQGPSTDERPRSQLPPPPPPPAPVSAPGPTSQPLPAPPAQVVAPPSIPIPSSPLASSPAVPAPLAPLATAAKPPGFALGAGGSFGLGAEPVKSSPEPLPAPPAPVATPPKDPPIRSAQWGWDGGAKGSTSAKSDWKDFAPAGGGKSAPSLTAREASDIAVSRDRKKSEEARRAEREGRDEAPEVEPRRDARRALVDLLGFVPALAQRIDRDRSFSSGTGLASLKRSDRDDERARILKILSCEEPQDAATLRGRVETLSRDPDRMELPLVVVEGELKPVFDEMEALKLTILAAQPLGGGDKRLGDTLKVANEMASSSWKPQGEAALSMARQIVDHAAQLSVPQKYIAQHVQRALLEGRHFKKRTVFGAPHVRADLVLPRSDRPLVAYVELGAAEKLPLLPSVHVIALGELRPREDAIETAQEAFLILALGRRLDLPPT